MKEIIMTAAQIAEAVNGKVKGNGEQTVKSVNSLKLAANDEVSFLSTVKYVNQLTASKAGIVLISDSGIMNLRKTRHSSSAIIRIKPSPVSAGSLLRILSTGAAGSILLP